MDSKATQMLLAFHASANKGSLHPNDENRLNNLIHYIAKQDWNLEDAVSEVYHNLIRQENKPWSEDGAWEIGLRVRRGVEVLRHDPDDF